MEILSLNAKLALGEIDEPGLFPHLDGLKKMPVVFENDFGLAQLPKEPGILTIRGPRQYGKSTWLEQQLYETIRSFGPATGFYLNGDYLADANALESGLLTLSGSFKKNSPIKRIFIDEITSISHWEIVLKRLIDNGALREILIVTTGSRATDLRRGIERLPGRKGKLARTNYLFTPISYQSFHKACHKRLKKNTLVSYLLSGGSPIACSELATQGTLSEYVVELARDWIEGEIAKSGRHRSALINIFNVLFRFGGSPVGQAKLAREAGLANNTVAQNYIELLNDLGCVVPAFPYDPDKRQLILRKPCKYHFINLLAALAYHPGRIRTPKDFADLPSQAQGQWIEWCVAQELQRRNAMAGSALLEPLAFWQNKNHEIDFVGQGDHFFEVKRGKTTPLAFGWFLKQFKQGHLTVINQSQFNTDRLTGITLENFLLGEKYTQSV